MKTFNLINKSSLKKICFMAIVFSYFCISYPKSAVTYTLSGGRFGDNLIAYLHAKWVAYKYNLSLLYMPFPLADELMMSQLEECYDQSKDRLFSKKITLKPKQSLEQFMSQDNGSTLFVIPYFPESIEDTITVTCPIIHFVRPGIVLPHFDIDWKDRNFQSIIKRFVSPKNNIELVALPCDYFSIAIHVRKNSNGFDLPLLHGLKQGEYNPHQKYVDAHFPLKHPPEDYYVQQLRYVVDRLPQEKFYVYIFTDDINPEAICHRFKNAMASAKIQWAYRTKNNNHINNILEDLFSMTKFDCLIRPDSNLSIVASKLGNYKIAIYPTDYHWEGTFLIIDNVNLELDATKMS